MRLSMLFMSLLLVGVAARAPITNELIAMTEGNATFKAQVINALQAGVDSGHLPKNFTFDKALDYVDSWVGAVPFPGNWSDYERGFGNFFLAPAGLDAVLSPLAKRWLFDFVTARGAFLDSPASLPAVRAWETSPMVNMSDFIIPEGGFRSFNDWFTRSLIPNARPISSSDVVSCADSMVSSITYNVSLTTVVNLRTKGEHIAVGAMLGGGPLADRFAGGSLIEVGLQASSYHHFHTPVGGTVVEVRQIGGLYFGWYFGVNSTLNAYTETRRAVIFIDSPVMGMVAVVACGTRTVSSLSIEVTPGQTIAKGARLGNFAFGGSMMAMVFEPSALLVPTGVLTGPVTCEHVFTTQPCPTSKVGEPLANLRRA